MERGERAVGEAAARRLSAYYNVPAEMIDLAIGQVPADILEILRDHPEEIAALRERHGA